MEVLLEVELLISVNTCGRARTVDSLWLIKKDVQGALTIAIAVRVARPVVALVRCSSESILVRLHHVELGTHVATDRRSIAVLEWVVIVLGRWHHDRIESGQAAAVTLGQVNVELEGTAEDVRLEVCPGVKGRRSGQVHAVVVVEADLCPVVYSGLSPVLRILHIELRVDSIDLYRESWELSCRSDVWGLIVATTSATTSLAPTFSV